MSNHDDFFLVHPKYGIVGYDNTNYGGTIYLSYQNNNNYPQVVRPSSYNRILSLKIFYNSNEII